MSVKFSREAGCYVWTCIYGCHGFDHESAEEAETALMRHACMQGR